MYQQELSEFGSMHLNDNFFSFGLVVTNNGEKYQFPESYGRFVSSIKGTTSTAAGEQKQHALVPCADVFTDLNQVLEGQYEKAVDDGLCFDPEHAVVDGSVMNGINQEAVMEFELCKDRNDSAAPGCLPLTLEPTDEISIELVYAHNFVDFESKIDPVTRGVSKYAIGQLNKKEYEKEIFLTVPLLVHDVAFNDELINPLSSDGNEFEFISADSYSAFNL